MGVNYSMWSMSGESEPLQRSGECPLDSNALIQFAEAANARLDQPDESSLDWIDAPPHYADDISPGSCYPPEEVIAGLEWLKRLALEGDATALDVWKTRFRETGPYSAERFMTWVGVDIEGLLDLCRKAKEQGDGVILVVVT